MEHTIVIYRKLKERNKEGNFNFTIVNRYKLTEEEICEREVEKYITDEDTEKYEFTADIEETKH